ncbi:MAG: flagellar basal body P-ring formation protein FlgA [Alphaproteobacteria bacterium]|nr:MAG: flagellar basal body P-ring formation protein FlgA [Alphaproteobacteria bacterium]
MSDIEIVKTPDMKRLMLAVAMTACVINSAWASEGYLTPKADVTITGDNVTVGDVFAGVTHDAGYVLAPAPGYGQSLTLNARDLQRVSDAFNLGWAPVSGFEQSVIHRSSHEIDRYGVEAAVQKSLAAAVTGQKFDIELSDRNISVHLPESLPATAEAQSLRYDLAKGEFRAVLAAPAGAAHPAVKQEIFGRIYPVTSVPVLKNPMRQGDVISADDIDYIDIRSNNVAASTIVDANRLIGMSPRRGVAGLKPVAMSEIALPVLVKKGDMVVMELKSGGIHLTTQGKAIDSGAEGETVHIENPSSHHVVQAVVTGAKAVSVIAPADGT